MNDEIIITKNSIISEEIEQDLDICNKKSRQFGLSLTYEQLLRINEERLFALSDMDRVEFGEGVYKKIILEFCDSPYIHQDDFEETISGLQEIFYYFKNESQEILSDDQLILFMKDQYDNVCHGSIEHLGSTILENYARRIRCDE